MNAGLTQVLSDGTNTYLYGNGRIGELQPGGFAYHLGDALGSVRQLTDASGNVTLAKSYEPYGTTMGSAGSGNSVFQYTGEARDASGLTFLRARYLSSDTGRFVSRDTWAGSYNRPISYNSWLYAYADPINLVDPAGLSPLCSEQRENVNFKGFTYTRCLGFGGPRSGLYRSLIVNLRNEPWNKYISKQAPATMSVPVRHPINLANEFGAAACDTLEEAQQLYASRAFYGWEVNARQVMSELNGVIESGNPWALPDAIGVAYNAYNRIQWNKNHPEDLYHPYEVSPNDPDFKLKGVLLPTGEQTALANPVSWWKGAHGPAGKYAQNIYEVSLIVAYGVDKGYFVDTSFGATIFIHRPPDPARWEWDNNKKEWIPKGNISGMECGADGPAFFYQDQQTYAQLGRKGALTSEQLWKQQGWGNGRSPSRPTQCQDWPELPSKPTTPSSP